ncbi:gamete antigen 27/25 [Plasmodium brasilianum]|uniref:Gamete antigen 27/25 (G27/25) n=2 Tax=Plasmodium (Plasmodium) TaxID=418103 RepID=A0A1A8WVR6_PLAMA|nr:gamete antigen 27/25, putative [Plasmodium malariae]KAI4834588.1 gamete antigen 27/25 [Plasmodium brasilianum]SBS96440.1 gamete antigen 27/25 (G27/25) [Plasmodium malariae]SCP03126.1 gamete antigen 27/25, putative [Plasmodium malariae]
MNIYIFLLIEILGIHIFIKCSAECVKENYPDHIEKITTRNRGECPYKLIYKPLPKGIVIEDVIELLNIEFQATIYFLFLELLPLNKHKADKTDKRELFSRISFDYLELPILYFMKHLGYSFKDERSRNSCINRMKKRLDLIVIEGILTKEYCERAQKYFWIEQRVIEEMSVKVFKEKTDDKQRNMCQNELAIKSLISKLERGRSI